MGGKSLVWAVAMVFALSLPAYAQKKSYAEKPSSSRSDKIFLKMTEVKGKVQKRATIGDETFLQEAETSVKTNHFRNETYTTYSCTWLETVTKSRTVTYEASRRWVYPCPGAGYWRISYGTRSENYNVDEPRSENVTRLTSSSDSSETQPKTTGSFRTVSRLGGGTISALASTAGAAGAGRDIGFSGDTGAGASGARSSSAGQTKKIAGATKAIKTFGAKSFDLSGDWSGGLSLKKTDEDSYDLALGGFKAQAKLNRGKGTLRVGEGKKALVDLTIGNGGNSLTGTVRGEAKTFSRTSK